MKNGWEVRSLGDLCTIKTGKKDVNSGNPKGIYPFFTCAKLHTYSDEYSFDTEALLIAGNGDVGNVSYYKGKFEAYQRTYVLSNFPDVFTRYLHLYLAGLLKDTVSKQKLGNTMPYIKVGMLKSFPVPLPPLEEQKQIVAVLDKALAAIDLAKANIEKNLQNAKELFQSKLNEIFTQKGEGWEETKIGSQIDLLSGFAFKSKEYVGESQGIKLLRGDNIVQGSFRWKDAKYWPKERLNEFEKFLLEDGDITLAMDRTWVKAGIKHAKVSADDLPCLLVQRVARLRCLESLNPDFLFFLLGSNLFEKYVLSIQTGLGVPHISGKQIQAFTFQKPEFKKQQEVVHNLNNLSDEVSLLLNKYQRKLQSLEEVRKSILQKAFSGELL